MSLDLQKKVLDMINTNESACLGIRKIPSFILASFCLSPTTLRKKRNGLDILALQGENDPDLVLKEQ